MKQIRKALSVMLAAVMLVCMAPAGVNAGAEDVCEVHKFFADGTVIEFGSYPQSLVTDAAVLSVLNERLSSADWVSYDYYYGDGSGAGREAPTASDYAKFTDVQLPDGTKYRGIRYTAYRPYSPYSVQNAAFTWQDENGLELNRTYWFKFEPIRWRVLDGADGYLVAEQLLDARGIYDYVFEVDGIGTIGHGGHTLGLVTQDGDIQDYDYSDLRDWLNGEFFRTAFSLSERVLVQDSVHNEFGDRVSLLSKEDAEACFASAADRAARVTDYTAYSGGYSVNGYGRYHTLSYYKDENDHTVYSWMVDTDGAFLGNASQEMNSRTVRPTIQLDCTRYLSAAETAADCTTDGLRPAINCAVCGAAIREAAVTPAAGHTDVCAAGDVIRYGSYPQKRVNDPATLSALNALSFTWNSYGYYYGTGDYGTMRQDPYMEYADVQYNGKQYRAVRFSQYRPETTCQPFYVDVNLTVNNNVWVDNAQYNNGYYKNCTYWFEYAPLEWKVLSVENDVAFVISLPIIDSQPFNNVAYSDGEQLYTDPALTVSAYDFENSTVRTWLNTVFIRDAFAGADAVPAADTFRNMTLAEATDPAYGFSADVDKNDPARIAYPSDYAICQGVYVNSDTVGANWGLQDRGDVMQGIYSVSSIGGFASDATMISNRKGVRPVAHIDFSAFRTVTVETPDCVKTGLARAKCVKCAAVYETVLPIDPNNHADYGTKLVNAAEATCTEPGYTGDTVCKGCNAVLGQGEAIAALGHDWGAWTDNGDGQHIRICRRNAEHKETVAHVWDDGVVTKTATCSEQGERTYTCTVCAAKKTEPIEIDPTNHAEYGTKLVKAAEATCTEKGYTGDTVCKGCEAVLEQGEEIDALGHDWGAWMDNGDGKHIRICRRNAEHKETVAHVWGAGVVTKTATCSVQGERTYTCTVCAAKKTESIAIDPNNHADYGTKIINTAEATCTEKGYTGDTVCKGCEAVLEQGGEIDALGHDWGAWMDNGDGQHIHICRRNAEHKQTAAHAFGPWTQVTAPDYDNEGQEARGCIFCTAKETRPIAKLVECTATFIADGKVIGTVKFRPGDTSIEEPSVPEKERMKGSWEDYTLGDEDITVYAQYHVIKDDTDVVDTDKRAVYDAAAGTAAIRLTASSGAQTVVTRTGDAPPLDIILVVDQSGSMQRISSNGKSRQENLILAARSFISRVSDDAAQKALDHRIAVVGFAMGENAISGLPAYQNTNILSLASGAKTYNKLKKRDYAAALVPVNANGAVNPILTNAVNAIQASGATSADLGLEMAGSIFANTEGDGRERVVVFMTDGVPTRTNTFSYSVANAAIQNADLLKNAYHASVYSVGVEMDEPLAAKFLQYVSSDIGTAEDLYEDHALTATGYTVSSDDSAALSGIFSDIVTETTVQTAAFTDLTFIDTVSAAFTLTAEQEKQLRADAIAQLGVTASDIRITRNDDQTTTVRIDHIVPRAAKVDGETKLVADFTFTVSANENALAKGFYKTNTEDAGVILGNGTEYEEVFVSPTVQLAEDRAVAVFRINGAVYRIAQIAPGTPVQAPDFTMEGDYTFSGWEIPEDCYINAGEARFFDAALTAPTYTVTWKIGDDVLHQTYRAGEIIAAPAAPQTIGTDVFRGWDAAVPTVMPARDLTFTANYSAHQHVWKSRTLKRVSCTQDGEIEKTCQLCGETETETVKANGPHSWVAILGEAATVDPAFCEFRCEKCGAYKNERLNYVVQAIKPSGYRNRTYEYELDLKDGDGFDIQPDGTLKITLYSYELYSAKEVCVYRVNDDGTRTKLLSKLDYGRLVFYTDHFCPYIIEGIFDCGEQNHKDENGDGKCDSCGAETAVPANPEQPDDTQSNCVCGKNHTGPFAWLIRFVHKIVYFFKRLFGAN